MIKMNSEVYNENNFGMLEKGVSVSERFDNLRAQMILTMSCNITFGLIKQTYEPIKLQLAICF